MIAQAIDPRAAVDTPANVQPVKSGEADPSMTVSPDTQDTADTIEALLCIRMEQLAKAKEAYRTVNNIDRAINRIVRESGLKLPFRCDYGMVRKGYDADRYPNPRHYRLRARRTLIGPKKAVVVKACAA